MKVMLAIQIMINGKRITKRNKNYNKKAKRIKEIKMGAPQKLIAVLQLVEPEEPKLVMQMILSLRVKMFAVILIPRNMLLLKWSIRKKYTLFLTTEKARLELLERPQCITRSRKKVILMKLLKPQRWKLNISSSGRVGRTCTTLGKL